MKMPSLITYERKHLTEAQYRALGSYIARKRLKEDTYENGIASSDVPVDNQTLPEEETLDIEPKSPVKPSPRQIRMEKEKELNSVQTELAELETMLVKLKEKKHELFEEVKSLVNKEREAKETQMHGYLSPFMHHPGIGPGPGMMISPFRPGMKRPKSPSPPPVQIYPSSSIQQPFPPMPNNRMQGPAESMNPSYQFRQNYPQRNLRQQVHGSHGPNSPQPSGNQFPPVDRNFPSFGTPQMSDNRMTSGHSTIPPPPPPAQPPFMQQNMQQNPSNDGVQGFSVSPSGKDRPGFNNPSSYRPSQGAGYTKRDGHGGNPGNRSRYH
ncbi:pollen-specific leucine-rich repeat extensin-like protein 1 [Dendronephthya gigantea]|uniref:pollen-specific leucine-rich repeat extensin-like protein 1 n=1 Tax=Dendronephthya gigantea TaxID=151771 RepID=UPI00106C8D40|nr:pollen-specific leucine-rich repeat extensin-like protein 1 [Dendronephthya gigantea]